MSENLDALLLHVEQLAPALPEVPHVNGVFIDPRQIARVLRDLYREDWQYVGAFRLGGHGDTQFLGYGDSLRPLYKDSRGIWYTAYKDQRRYGEPDRAGTLMLLRYAQDNGL